jgi:hypothetical protein
MKRFLDRHESEARRVTALPQRQVRPQGLRYHLEEYLLLIMETVPIAPVELMFNLDESGLSDWENQKSKPVLMPAIKENSTLHYPIDWSTGTAPSCAMVQPQKVHVVPF